MSGIRLAAGRAVLVCDVCLAYVDDDDPSIAAWHRERPGHVGGPDRCPECTEHSGVDAALLLPGRARPA